MRITKSHEFRCKTFPFKIRLCVELIIGMLFIIKIAHKPLTNMKAVTRSFVRKPIESGYLERTNFAGLFMHVLHDFIVLF